MVRRESSVATDSHTPRSPNAAECLGWAATCPRSVNTAATTSLSPRCTFTRLDATNKPPFFATKCTLLSLPLAYTPSSVMHCSSVRREMVGLCSSCSSMWMPPSRRATRP